LVDWEAEDASVKLGDIGRILDALLELDVFVPEGVALEVKADEMGAALKEPKLLALLYTPCICVGKHMLRHR
jgi:hypothetical protein